MDPKVGEKVNWLLGDFHTSPSWRMTGWIVNRGNSPNLNGWRASYHLCAGQHDDLGEICTWDTGCGGSLDMHACTLCTFPCGPLMFCVKLPNQCHGKKHSAFQQFFSMISLLRYNIVSESLPDLSLVRHNQPVHMLLLTWHITPSSVL